jgi:hypothetical protein
VYVASNDPKTIPRFVGTYCWHMQQQQQQQQPQSRRQSQRPSVAVVVRGGSEAQAAVAAVMGAAVALEAEWMLPPLLCLLPLLGCQSVDHPAVLRVLQAACTVGVPSTSPLPA